jgi:hypothetical protein
MYRGLGGEEGIFTSLISIFGMMILLQPNKKVESQAKNVTVELYRRGMAEPSHFLEI